MSSTAELEYTPEVALATQPVYELLKSVIPEFEWPIHAPYVEAINRLKRERNAVILAHNYMTPEIFHGVADIVGDSLALARKASETDADIIVLAGVHFMAETAKLLSPEKTVLMPDMDAGCSLASSITAADIQLLREKYPGVPVVTYVNTSAEVKAESDICCTSGNAVKIVESLGVDRVICLPDQYLARYIGSQTDVEVIYWEGSCEVHERFTGKELRDYRSQFKDIVIVAHPECPEDVLNEADFVGSTAHMINYVGDAQPGRVLLVTECSMSDNVAIEYPNVEFIRPCNLCPHMKLITLPKILDSLTNMSPKIEVDNSVAERARVTVERMLAFS
ncbi:MAG: quinolinate synthase NadA [Alphaproteobacteria bacterium]|jgi:quinolinate synthase|nr:quinolinate synthase NadA [Alphaproteobacteria bacterium]